jgi:DNA-binding transcriptional ArsR family regulator
MAVSGSREFPVPASTRESVASLCYFEYNKNMEETEVIKSLAALAQPWRLRVFRALVVVGEKGLTPGTMSEALGIPAATLSFHLKELMNAGLVTQERASRHLIYRAAYDRMNSLLGYLTQNCCQGAECLDEVAVACKC